ncbi:MAG: hypothetical protein ACK2TV_15740 [Anaerolineales bacterium]
MSSASEQSKEMAIFCQRESKKSKRGVFKSWLEKAALQGVMIALLAVSTTGGIGETPGRSGPWVTAG